MKDSEEFKEALRIWHPLLFTRLKTPRAIKRFMNRVRYLAMRQRQATARGSLWERVRLRLSRLFRPAPSEAGDAAQTTTHIPEHLLVALSAAQQIDPRLVERNVKALFQSGRPVPSILDADTHALLAEAEAAHERRFGQQLIDITDSQRAAFLKMSADIRVN